MNVQRAYTAPSGTVYYRVEGTTPSGWQFFGEVYGKLPDGGFVEVDGYRVAPLDPLYDALMEALPCK